MLAFSRRSIAGLRHCVDHVTSRRLLPNVKSTILRLACPKFVSTHPQSLRSDPPRRGDNIGPRTRYQHCPSHALSGFDPRSSRRPFFPLLSSFPLRLPGTSAFSSSTGGEGYGLLKLDPDFTVFGNDCILKFRLTNYQFPASTAIPGGGGEGGAGPSRVKPINSRLLVEFTRRKSSGTYDWKGTKRLSLTAEEIGLLLDCGPSEELIFRRTRGGEGIGGGTIESAGPVPQREMKVIPTTTGGWAVRFSIENEDLFDVTVSRGRKAVLKSLIHTSLPAIFGWGGGSRGEGGEGGRGGGGEEGGRGTEEEGAPF